MKRTKLTSREQELVQHAAGQLAHEQPIREFASAEEMLRHDALHTPVPPTIAHRLQASLGHAPAPASPSWWRRFFKR